MGKVKRERLIFKAFSKTLSWKAGVWKAKILLKWAKFLWEHVPGPTQL